MAEMFTQVVQPSTRIGAKRWYSVPLSILAHAALLAALVAVPLLMSGTLPLTPSMLVFAAPAPPTPPEIPRAPTPPKSAVTATTATPPSGPPTEAPSTIQPETPSFAIAVPGSVGLPDGLPGVTVGLPALSVTLPGPAPAVVTEPLRLGGQIKAPIKIHDVAPIYPPFAVRAKISGYVIIETTIDVEGRVTDATVLRSVPGLDQAALDAVRQWRYRPTLLNGIAVSIRMTVTVTFALK
jgi:protein TonB